MVNSAAPLRRPCPYEIAECAKRSLSCLLLHYLLSADAILLLQQLCLRSEIQRQRPQANFVQFQSSNFSDATLQYPPQLLNEYR